MSQSKFKFKFKSRIRQKLEKTWFNLKKITRVNSLNEEVMNTNTNTQMSTEMNTEINIETKIILNDFLHPPISDIVWEYAQITKEYMCKFRKRKRKDDRRWLVETDLVETFIDGKAHIIHYIGCFRGVRWSKHPQVVQYDDMMIVFAENYNVDSNYECSSDDKDRHKGYGYGTCGILCFKKCNQNDGLILIGKGWPQYPILGAHFCFFNGTIWGVSDTALKLNSAGWIRSTIDGNRQWIPASIHPLHYKRHACATISFRDKLYVIGGEASPTTMEWYDLAKGVWVLGKDKLNYGRSGHALALCGSSILAIGGFNTRTTEIWSTSSNEGWIETGSLNHTYNSIHIVSLNKQIICVGTTQEGQKIAEIYDPRLGQWTITKEYNFDDAKLIFPCVFSDSVVDKYKYSMNNEYSV